MVAGGGSTRRLVGAAVSTSPSPRGRECDLLSIRPPLVGCPASFGRLYRALRTGVVVSRPLRRRPASVLDHHGGVMKVAQQGEASSSQPDHGDGENGEED